MLRGCQIIVAAFPPHYVSKGHRAQVGREEIYAATANNIESTSTSCCKIHTQHCSAVNLLYSEPLSPAVSWGTWQAAEKAGRVKTAAVPIPCQTYKKLPVPIFSSGTNVQFSSHPVTITRGNLTVEHLTNNKLSFSSLGRTPDWLRLILCQFSVSRFIALTSKYFSIQMLTRHFLWRAFTGRSFSLFIQISITGR